MTHWQTKDFPWSPDAGDTWEKEGLFFVFELGFWTSADEAILPASKSALQSRAAGFLKDRLLIGALEQGGCGEAAVAAL